MNGSNPTLCDQIFSMLMSCGEIRDNQVLRYCFWGVLLGIDSRKLRRMNAGKPVLRCHLLMTDTRKSFLARNQDSLFNGSRFLLANDTSCQALQKKKSYYVSNIIPKCMSF